MRKPTRFAGLALTGLLLSGAAAAAEIHGTVSEGGKAVAAGVPLKLECGGASVSASTDQFGGYSLKTSATGDCRLSIEYKGSSAALRVAVYEKPSRYDLNVQADGGKLTLTRK